MDQLTALLIRCGSDKNKQDDGEGVPVTHFSRTIIALVALLTVSTAQAAPISVGSGAFSGSETLITFDSVIDGVPLGTIGPVTFTNLWGETSAPDGLATNFTVGCSTSVGTDKLTVAGRQ
jgi:hypothetical protein